MSKHKSNAPTPPRGPRPPDTPATVGPPTAESSGPAPETTVEDETAGLSVAELEEQARRETALAQIKAARKLSAESEVPDVSDVSGGTLPQSLAGQAANELARRQSAKRALKGKLEEAATLVKEAGVERFWLTGSLTAPFRKVGDRLVYGGLPVEARNIKGTPEKPVEVWLPALVARSNETTGEVIVYPQPETDILQRDEPLPLEDSVRVRKIAGQDLRTTAAPAPTPAVPQGPFRPDGLGEAAKIHTI